MKRLLSLTLFFFIVFNFEFSAQNQVEVEFRKCIRLWETENYDQAIDGLKRLRENSLYGRNWKVHYLLASSYCNMTNLNSKGREYYKWILDNQNISPGLRTHIKGEIENCGMNNGGERTIAVLDNEEDPVSAIVSSKNYYYEAAENGGDGTELARFGTVIDKRDFWKRLMVKDSSKLILDSLLQNEWGDYRISKTTNFIIISFSRHSNNMLNDIGTNLERYFKFYCDNYKFNPGPYYIVIYLLPDMYELEKLALKLHGVILPQGQYACIGYTFHEDQSILAVIPEMKFGTVKHELFHILLKANYGDSPPWIDEGISSLYEVSKIENDAVIGLNNWRANVLKQRRSIMPPIEQLISMNWEDFNNASDQMVNHATARYFVLYLQDIGYLAKLFDDIRNKPIADSSIYYSNKDIVERVLNKNISEINPDFQNWLSQELNKEQY